MKKNFIMILSLGIMGCFTSPSKKPEPEFTQKPEVKVKSDGTGEVDIPKDRTLYLKVQLVSNDRKDSSIWMSYDAYTRYLSILKARSIQGSDISYKLKMKYDGNDQTAQITEIDVSAKGEQSPKVGQILTSSHVNLGSGLHQREVIVSLNQMNMLWKSAQVNIQNLQPNKLRVDQVTPLSDVGSGFQYFAPVFTKDGVLYSNLNVSANLLSTKLFSIKYTLLSADTNLSLDPYLVIKWQLWDSMTHQLSTTQSLDTVFFY